MVLLITLSASALGSQWSGLLSPVPFLAWPLCVFVHHQQGSDAARAYFGAYWRVLMESWSSTIFAGGLGRLSPIFVYVVAILAALTVSIPWLKSKLVLCREGVSASRTP